MEHAVLISGSPSPRSRSRGLLERAAGQLEGAGFTATIIDLAGLPAEGLLGRRPDPEVATALAATQAARIVVASSPVYRATYSGLLKVFFDLLPANALLGTIGLPIMTGGSLAHALAVDHGLRALVASLGATVVGTGVYGYEAQFGADGIDPELVTQLDRAVEETVTLSRASAPAVRH